MKFDISTIYVNRIQFEMFNWIFSNHQLTWRSLNWNQDESKLAYKSHTLVEIEGFVGPLWPSFATWWVCFERCHDYSSMLHPADLDECLNGELEERPVCTERGRERCVNTEGSFRCVAACRPGYRPLDIEERLGDDSDDNPEDDDHGCVDIDECVSGNHTCTLAEMLDSFSLLKF